MSAEIFKLYFGADRLIHPMKIFSTTLHLQCFKTPSCVLDIRSFRPPHTCKISHQRISLEKYKPVRNYCLLVSLCEPYSYRTSRTLKKLVGPSLRTPNEINGSCQNPYLPVHDPSKGFQTCCVLRQVDKAKKDDEIAEESVKPEEKLSLLKRYKKMLKEYWYVLIPVHMATSLIWFGSFYYVATCGFDLIPILEKLGAGESIIEPFRNSSLGYIAVASALYKIATPARYMVTLGGTTIAVKYLTKYGLVKPVPSKDQIKSMIQKKFKQQTRENS